MTEPLYKWQVKVRVIQSCLKTSVKQPDRRGGGREKKKCVKGEKEGQRRCMQRLLCLPHAPHPQTETKHPPEHQVHVVARYAPLPFGRLRTKPAKPISPSQSCCEQNQAHMHHSKQHPWAICWSLIQPRRWQRTSEWSAARWEINQRTTTRHRPTSVHTFSDAWPKQISEFRPISSRSFQENMQHLKHIKYIKGHLK